MPSDQSSFPPRSSVNASTNVDLSPVVDQQQQLIRIMARILLALESVFPMATGLPLYTVAGLPATANIGASAYATNGRKDGEAVGAGTGVPVTFDVSGNWFADWSSAQVTS